MAFVSSVLLSMKRLRTRGDEFAFVQWSYASTTLMSSTIWDPGRRCDADVDVDLNKRQRQRRLRYQQEVPTPIIRHISLHNPPRGFAVRVEPRHSNWCYMTFAEINNKAVTSRCRSSQWEIKSESLRRDGSDKKKSMARNSHFATKLLSNLNIPLIDAACYVTPTLLYQSEKRQISMFGSTCLSSRVGNEKTFL